MSYGLFSGGAVPIGGLVSVAHRMTDADYVPCLGQKLLRADYPKLAACMPNVGAISLIKRTRPNDGYFSQPICAAGARWITAPHETGVGNISTTTDGITYAASVAPANCYAQSLIYDGVNVIGANAGGLPVYSTNGGLNFLQSATGAACSVVSGYWGSQAVMDRAPTLGATGRTLFAAGANFYYSDSRGVSWTAVAHGLGANALYVCWTGTKWLATTGTGSAGILYQSATGLAGTWTRMDIPWTFSGGVIVSDGAGRVVICGAPLSSTPREGVLVSINGGDSFIPLHVAMLQIGQTGVPLISSVSYTNGKFFGSGFYNGTNGNHLFVSDDLVSWVDVPDVVLPGSAECVFSFKAGVYLVHAYNSTAVTLTEDMTKMYMPITTRETQANGSTGGVSPMQTMTYIKAK